LKFFLHFSIENCYAIPIQDDDRIVPLEAKSGLSVNAKSLRFYRDTFKPQLAIRASMKNLRLDDGLLNIPLYLLGELPRMLELAHKQKNL